MHLKVKTSSCYWSRSSLDKCCSSALKRCLYSWGWTILSLWLVEIRNQPTSKGREPWAGTHAHFRWGSEKAALTVSPVTTYAYFCSARITCFLILFIKNSSVIWDFIVDKNDHNLVRSRWLMQNIFSEFNFFPSSWIKVYWLQIIQPIDKDIKRYFKTTYIHVWMYAPDQNFSSPEIIHWVWQNV